ncbi:hypothetical protein SERLA73DRAFT_175260 [Serpula lacrymans var. lacrymans S7.3]|uniref:Uncharacterized protein n=1 Tax=Serpula lacrymans var. lacrymans (strain S7.3) TaxID=936435 RepID=F8PIP9_SERL3|nr:hypothetical protein SERLA73DRAFT_175260 [Serpula lacrymans var. lacrymans S7.3]
MSPKIRSSSAFNISRRSTSSTGTLIPPSLVQSRHLPSEQFLKKSVVITSTPSREDDEWLRDAIPLIWDSAQIKAV